uniref:60S ribosomal protein L18a n=1 Tax=Strombidium rassoulzadegani TaxID=1082188 RepID=A0A7S3CMQ9_9SPIT|mmetsp:Transcript_14352/g.24433  ORF Transcript_14352/g.24433 Transcript_14352/m.24433 type:complete len:187 (+) Transcript_14352:52-612(+)|eukprot:CAMPEP_0168607586 /NCGR_PEP_ID=MMETSP0449_2-20121227/136_1 /TAXON_ID=1082188 /ORGANISM="Strombidium rassoulzadegani, Strain ras09" /LENGTH=186 /DNA_ID=CAMNT_0008647441 /DNA_START=54 /DNA_END=614 /DNA_ORIENTATION=-
MTKGVALQGMQKNVRQYWVVGRKLPTEATPEPTCYRIRVFAKNIVIARSQFWYEMKRQNKVRKCQGEIVSVSEIHERKTNSIKLYGIVLKYLSSTGIVNMYREVRSNSLNNAISLIYNEMAGRHSARAENIHIFKTMIINKKDEIRRTEPTQLARASLKFPKITTVKRAPTASHKSTFTAQRPLLI